MVMTERSKEIEIIRKMESKVKSVLFVSLISSSKDSAQRNSEKHSRHFILQFSAFMNC